jgi:hypothetical protein
MSATILLGVPGLGLADWMPTRSSSYCCESRTWSGVYAGFQAGGAWGNSGCSSPFVETYNTGPRQRFSTSPEGGLAGGQLGINRQLGSFLVGAEATLAGTNVEQTRMGPVTTTFPLDRFKADVSHLFAASGRIGVVADSMLFFSKGGYANANVDVGAVSEPPVAGIT